jgi:hypothetical protein
MQAPTLKSAEGEIEEDEDVNTNNEDTFEAFFGLSWGNRGNYRYL